MYALTTNFSHLVEQRLVSAPILHPPIVKDPLLSPVRDKSPLQSSSVTLRGDDTCLLQQNKQFLEAVQTLSQNTQSLVEKTEECEQHITDLARVSHERWAKVVLECSLIRTELQEVFHKLNEEDILLSPKNNEITSFWQEGVVTEAQAQMRAFGRVNNEKMERYESLEQD